MKKTLTCLLAFLASCTLFVACDSGKKDSSTPDTSTPAESTPDESTVTDPHAEALNLAKDYVYGQLVEKDTEVRTDYTLMGSYYSFFLEEDLTVAWTVDVTEGVTLTLDEENKEWKVDVDEHLEEDLFYVLTGTISDSDGHSVSFTLERKVLKAEQVVPEKITEAPVEGTAYKLYMYQATKKTDLYFTGKMSGYFMATTNASNGDTYLNGVDVYAEKVEGKDAYYLTFTDEKDVKQYIGVTNVWSSGSFHDNAIFAASTAVADGEVKTFEFTWSSEYGTMIATLEGAKSGKDEATTETKTVSYFLGTSGSHYTFGACPVEEAADSYVGCLVKMVDKSQVSAEDKVASEKMTLNVTTAYSGAVEETLPTVGTVYGDVAISWAVKSGDATIENNVLKVAAPTADTTIVLTATFVCGEASDTLDVDINVYPKSPVTAVTEPKAGEAYAIYMYQAGMAKNYYFTGVMSGKYLATTDDASQAADVYIEDATDGFKIYVLGENDAKSYITLTEYKQDGKNYYSASISLTADGSVFTYNTQFGTLCCKTENDTFFLGTYGTYTTISASRSYYMTADKIGTEQFVATFGIIDESAIVPPTEGGEDDGETEITNPTLGTGAYKFFLTQVTNGQTLYIDGGVSGRYLTMTETATEGVDVYAEEVDGSYKFYILVEEAKQYINIYFNSDNKVSVNYAAETTCAFDYNAETNCWYTNIDGTDYYLGTYKTFDTVSASSTSYITAENTGVSQFPLELVTKAIAEQPVLDETAAYKFFLTQVTNNQTLYIDGGVSGRYLTMTETATDGVDVYAEKVDGGYKFYILVEEAKQYVNIYFNSDNKVSVNYAAETTCVYLYNAETNCWYTNIDGTDYYLGTYKTFDTVSASSTSYISAENTGVSQFPLELIKASDITEGGEGEEGGEDSGAVTLPEQTAENTKTIDEILAMDTANLPTEAFYVTGTIKSVYKAQYGNMYITDEDGTQLTVYGSYNSDGTVGYANMTEKPDEADVVLFYSKISQYNGTPQLLNAWIISWTAGEPVVEAGVVNIDCSQISGTQYADETHKIDDNVTISTHNGGCHFNTQLRIYDSSSNNGWAIITSTKVIKGLSFNAGNKAATLEVYGSVDGTTWVKIQDVATTSAYADHTVAIDEAAGYKYLKFDAVGAQIRIASFALTLVE